MVTIMNPQRMAQRSFDSSFLHVLASNRSGNKNKKTVHSLETSGACPMVVSGLNCSTSQFFTSVHKSLPMHSNEPNVLGGRVSILSQDHSSLTYSFELASLHLMMKARVVKQMPHVPFS